MVKCMRAVRVFLFFKQKTAYEMRISDWSSDVCSSDLRSSVDHARRYVGIRSWRAAVRARRRACPGRCSGSPAGPCRCGRRSEEHTSELQSLMRISYAVFCLKKKKTIKKQNTRGEQT